MRHLQRYRERIATLVELLSEMGTLEIRATVHLVGANPSSDEARVLIHFTGSDTPLLTANNGRVLDAIEVIATEIMGLSFGEREAIRFDAGDFLAEQEDKLRRAAEDAIGKVRFTGTPFVFPPMVSRDRRFLENSLILSGLYFETLGQGATKWVVLFPKELGAAFEDAASFVPTRH